MEINTKNMDLYLVQIPQHVNTFLIQVNTDEIKHIDQLEKCCNHLDKSMESDLTKRLYVLEEGR